VIEISKNCLPSNIEVIPIEFQKDMDHFYNFLFINKNVKEFERINLYFPELSEPNIDQQIVSHLGENIAGYKILPTLNKNYFESLYYLETRILNQSMTRDQILYNLGNMPDMSRMYRDKYVNIVLPLSGEYKPPLHPELLAIPLIISPSPPKSDRLKGIVFCHGHKDDRKRIENKLSRFPIDVKWTYIDNNPVVRPDIVADIYSMTNLNNIGVFQWDYVYADHCPIYADLIDIQRVIRSGRWLIRTGGKIIIPQLYLALSGLLNKENVNEYLSETVTFHHLNGSEILNDGTIIFF
jgi:hypothetical protein